MSDPVRRLIHSLRAVTGRLRRPSIQNGGGAVWNVHMTILLALGLAVSLFLMQFDAWILEQARLHKTSQSETMQTLTRLGLSKWYLITAGLVLIIAGAKDWQQHGNRGRSRLALFFGQAAYAFAAVALSGLLTNLFKILIERARPRLFEQYGSLHFEPFTAGYDFASYPSGHSTTAGAVTMILMLWFPKWSVPTLAAGMIIAITRIMVGAHYASDVVAGFSVGVLVTLFIARWLAARALVFRIGGHETFPTLRYLRSPQRKSVRPE